MAVMEEPRENATEVMEVDEGLEGLFRHPSMKEAEVQIVYKIYLLALTRGMFAPELG